MVFCTATHYITGKIVFGQWIKVCNAFFCSAEFRSVTFHRLFLFAYFDLISTSFLLLLIILLLLLLLLLLPPPLLLLLLFLLLFLLHPLPPTPLRCTLTRIVLEAQKQQMTHLYEAQITAFCLSCLSGSRFLSHHHGPCMTSSEPIPRPNSPKLLRGLLGGVPGTIGVPGGAAGELPRGLPGGVPGLQTGDTQRRAVFRQHTRHSSGNPRQFPQHYPPSTLIVPGTPVSRALPPRCNRAGIRNALHYRKKRFGQIITFCNTLQCRIYCFENWIFTCTSCGIS